MRLPFPTRLNIQYVLILLALVMMAQVLNGTDPLFAFLACVAMLFTVLAFNQLGGLSTASGAFVLFIALSTYVTTIFVKIFTFEPSNKNFHQPIATIAATAIGFFGIMISAWLSRKFISPRPLVRFSTTDLENLGNTAGGVVFLGLLSQFLLSSFGMNQAGFVVNGSFWAILNQMNIFIPLAIVLGTYYTIYMSRGQKSMNWVAIVSIMA